jgi:hypothetical protein
MLRWISPPKKINLNVKIRRRVTVVWYLKMKKVSSVQGQVPAVSFFVGVQIHVPKANLRDVRRADVSPILTKTTDLRPPPHLCRVLKKFEDILKVKAICHPPS